MSSTLIITADASWMPTSWIFGEVVGRVRSALPASEAALAGAIDEMVETGFPFLDLSELEPSATPAFERAARQAFDDLAGTAPSELGEPRHYVNLQWALSELLAVLQCLGEGAGRMRSLLLPSGPWTAPAVAVATAAEHVAVWLRAETASTDVVSTLLAPTTTDAVDLTSASKPEANDLRTAIERVVDWSVGAGKVWVYAPLERIVEERLPALGELAQASWP